MVAASTPPPTCGKYRLDLCPDIGLDDGVLRVTADAPFGAMDEPAHATGAQSSTATDGVIDMDPNEQLAPDFDCADIDHLSNFDCVDIGHLLNFDNAFDIGVPNNTWLERVKLLAGSPWFRLREILSKRVRCVLNPLIRQQPTLTALAGLGNHVSPCSTSVPRPSSALVKISVAERQAHLAGLLGPVSVSGDPGACATAVPTLTAKLSQILPEYPDGEASSAVHEFLDPTNKDPLQDLFGFACYFFSNTMLTRDQRLAFMRWVMEKNCTQKLASFLAIQSTGVDGFRHGVIATIMDMADLRLVTLLVQSGVGFDDVLAQATGVSDQKFFDSLVEYGLDQTVFRKLSGSIGTLLLERAMGSADERLVVRLLNAPESPDLVAGPAGGQLLRLAAGNGYVQASKTLIRRGSGLDTLPPDGEPSTPLGLAVWLGHTEVAKCLVEAGASLSMASTHGRHAMQPLALAVRQGRMEIITILVENKACLDCRIGRLDIFRWSSENNTRVYRHLCTLTGRDGTLDKSKVTVARIAREADRGPGPFAIFHREHGANITDQHLEEALELAVKKGMVGAVSTLLSAGVNPDAPEITAREPLISRILWSQCYGETNYYSDPDQLILDLLLDSGANSNHKRVVREMQCVITEGQMSLSHFQKFLNARLDVEKHGPGLLVASVPESIDIMVALIEKGVSPNSYSEPGRGLTALQEAAYCGRIDLIDYLQQHGGDINKPASRFEGYTALQAASRSQEKRAVLYLLEQNADVNAPPSADGGSTALEASLWGKESTELFELLLERGASLDQPPGHSGRILRRLIDQKFHTANLLRLVSLALDAGADPNEMLTDRTILASRERTALQLAAETGSLDLVKLLVSRNGNVNQQACGNGGKTALQAAVSRAEPQMELVRYLLEQGADVHAAPAGTYGHTALQGASIQGHVNIVLLLLGRGADPNARPALKDGRTALQGAAEHGRLEVVQVLLNAGARPYRWDESSGFQAEIRLAEKNRHFAIAKLLRSHEQELCETT